VHPRKVAPLDRPAGGVEEGGGCLGRAQEGLLQPLLVFRVRAPNFNHAGSQRCRAGLDLPCDHDNSAHSASGGVLKRCASC
jgi:hypothetical protein